jgi:hypothetical protein
MTSRESLLREIDDVPDSVLDEVADFVHVLKARIARASTSTSTSDGLTIAADALKTAYETDSELTAFTTLCIDEYRQNG